MSATTTPEQLAMDKQEQDVLKAVPAPYSDAEHALILGDVESKLYDQPRLFRKALRVAQIIEHGGHPGAW